MVDRIYRNYRSKSVFVAKRFIGVSRFVFVAPAFRFSRKSSNYLRNKQNSEQNMCKKLGKAKKTLYFCKGENNI